MVKKKIAQKILNEMHRKQAVFLGELMAVHEVEDEVIWSLAKNLDALREAAMQEIELSASPTSNPSFETTQADRFHPAVMEYLNKINRESPDLFGQE